MFGLEDIFQHFIETDQQEFDLERREVALKKAEQFEASTDGHFRVLMKFRSTNSLPEEDNNYCKRLEIMLSEERNTWRLIKALLKDNLITGEPLSISAQDVSLISQNGFSHDSNRMDDSDEIQQNGFEENAFFSEDQLIGNYYVSNAEIRLMQVISDWLEANEAGDSAYRDELDKVEFYSEGRAWEYTLYAIKSAHNSEPIEVCQSMDPDAPLRNKKSLVHQDKEIELRLFKQLLRSIRAGKLEEGQELARRVGYFWLSAFLDGWLPYSDPNLDQENLGAAIIDHRNEIQPVTGNKKRRVWKRTCFMAARTPGLNSCEKAILGVLGGNLKSVLPACHTWSDQLWARIRCSIDVKIERALHDVVPRDNLIDLPKEFFENYHTLESIFKSIADVKSQYMEATIQQTIQKHLMLNNIDGLMDQLTRWTDPAVIQYDHTAASISPQFLRCFTHIALLLREIGLIDSDDARSTMIIESYIGLLAKQKSPESVAYYCSYLPKENQTINYAKLLSLVCDREERCYCLKIAKKFGLDIDDITQTVVRMIREEVTADKRKIDALDYLLLLDVRNYIAILHHGNNLLRLFAMQRKTEAARETYTKLPKNLAEKVAKQWVEHTNSDIPLMLKDSLRELACFKALLDAEEQVAQWSDFHQGKPKEPRRPANLSKFCENVNYEQRLKQYQHDLSVWRESLTLRTNNLLEKISDMLQFPGGWMRDLAPANDGNNQCPNPERKEQLAELRKHFVPHMISICFNILQLTARYENCLRLSHLLADEELKLYEDFSKPELRLFMDKIAEVTKLIVKQSLIEEAAKAAQSQ